VNLTDKLNSSDYGFCIYSYPLGDMFNKEDGIRVCVSSWTRINDNMIPPRGKITGTYVNLALVLYDARSSGYDDAIILTQDGHVAEGAGQNIVILRNGSFVSPPITEDVLEGITLDSVTQIIEKELSMTIERRRVDRTELYLSDEIFFCGTGCQITPVVAVDNRRIGTGEPGKLTRAVQKAFFEVVRGENAEYEQWLTPV
jgi:branched-chain amino acid aminotransferase